MIDTLLGDPLARDALLAGVAVVTMCAVLSVLVVVKRLGFVGQGVSHSAFGGVGVASIAAIFVPASIGAAAFDGVQFGIVALFCIAAALGMAALSRRPQTSEDTAIGMFLVGSMALGAILLHASGAIAARVGRPPTAQSWESILFGSILLISRYETIAAWLIAAGVLAVAWWVRRPLLFWAFDEESAAAFGVRTGAMRAVLMVLLAIAVVVAMRLTGVVLATALLVLPGAAALRLCERLWSTVLVSVAFGVAGLIAGLTLSIRLDWPTGPCIVGMLTVLYAIAAAGGRNPLRRTGASPAAST